MSWITDKFIKAHLKRIRKLRDQYHLEYFITGKFPDWDEFVKNRKNLK